MSGPHVEYAGFTAGETVRQYTLRVRQAGGESQTFTLSIPNEAFVDHRVRYQDGPEICFLKLQRQLLACGEQLPALHLDVTDDDLRDFRAARAPKAKQTRPKKPKTSSTW